MPLCRGTAMVGYIVTLSLFRAAGLEVTASIPPGKQVGIASAGNRQIDWPMRRDEKGGKEGIG